MTILQAPSEVLDDDCPLSLEEEIELKQLESVIERGLKTFVEVGYALECIRSNKRLYQRRYRTFESYCEERWGLSRQRAHQIMTAADIASSLSKNFDIIPCESHATALSRAPFESRSEIWGEVLDRAAGDKVTAKLVRDVVGERMGSPSETDSPREWTLDDAIEHLGSKLYDISQRWPRQSLSVMVDQLRCLADELSTYGELRP